MSKVPCRWSFGLLAVVLLAMFTFTLTAAADESVAVEDPACGSTDSRLASDAECAGEPSAQATAIAAAHAVGVAGSLPPNCRLHAEAIFWTASDWPTLADAFAADPSPCADYYISLPPLAADKKRLRVLQDDLIRAHGPRIHPVAEVTLGGATGWANSWV